MHDNKFARQLILHRLIFLSKLGGKLSGKSAKTVLNESIVNWTNEDHGNIIKHNGWTLTIPDKEHLQSKVKWPVNPFNSYRLDAKSDLACAALMLSTDFNIPNKEVEYILEIT
jgi:nitrogen fixation protein